MKLWVFLLIQSGESINAVLADVGLVENQFDIWKTEPTYDYYIQCSTSIYSKYPGKSRILFCPLHDKINILGSLWRDFISEGKGLLYAPPKPCDYDCDNPSEEPYLTLWTAVELLYHGVEGLSRIRNVDQESLVCSLYANGDYDLIEKHAEAIWDILLNIFDVYKTAGEYVRFLGAVYHQYVRQGRASELLEAYEARKEGFQMKNPVTTTLSSVLGNYSNSKQSPPELEKYDDGNMSQGDFSIVEIQETEMDKGGPISGGEATN